MGTTDGSAGVGGWGGRDGRTARVQPAARRFSSVVRASFERGLRPRHGAADLPERLGFFAAVRSEASPDGRRELALAERDRAPSSFGMAMGGPEALFCGSRGCSMEGAGSSKSIENCMASSSLALEALRLRMDDEGAKPSEPARFVPLVRAAGAGSMKLLWLF